MLPNLSAFQIEGLIHGRLTSTFYFLQRFYEFWVDRGGYNKLENYDARSVRMKYTKTNRKPSVATKKLSDFSDIPGVESDHKVQNNSWVIR